MQPDVFHIFSNWLANDGVEDADTRIHFRKNFLLRTRHRSLGPDPSIELAISDEFIMTSHL